MEIRRNMVPPQVQNQGKITNEPITGEAEEMQGTTVQPVDVEVLFAQSDNNTGNTNGNNDSNPPPKSRLDTLNKSKEEIDLEMKESVEKLIRRDESEELTERHEFLS